MEGPCVGHLTIEIEVGTGGTIAERSHALPLQSDGRARLPANGWRSKTGISVGTKSDPDASSELFNHVLQLGPGHVDLVPHSKGNYPARPHPAVERRSAHIDTGPFLQNAPGIARAEHRRPARSQDVADGRFLILVWKPGFKDWIHDTLARSGQMTQPDARPAHAP